MAQQGGARGLIDRPRNAPRGGGTSVRFDGHRARNEWVKDLFVEYARSRDPEIRNRLILMHLSLVRLLAARFAHRGEPLEDLIQVGSIALIRAVDRYQPERGHQFSTFATPTIVGEIKRHFRDKAWRLKAPRALQELSFRMIQANERLSQELGRSPTIAEIAAHTGTSEETALEAMELCHSYEMLSLDSPCMVEGQETTSTLAEELGAPDPALHRVEAYAALRAAIERLEERQGQIIRLRFFEEFSQMEVAERLGISQMHVSRLERRALRRLKELLAAQVEEETAAACR